MTGDSPDTIEMIRGELDGVNHNLNKLNITLNKLLEVLDEFTSRTIQVECSCCKHDDED